MAGYPHEHWLVVPATTTTDSTCFNEIFMRNYAFILHPVHVPGKFPPETKTKNSEAPRNDSSVLAHNAQWRDSKINSRYFKALSTSPGNEAWGQIHSHFSAGNSGNWIDFTTRYISPFASCRRLNYLAGCVCYRMQAKLRRTSTSTSQSPSPSIIG